MSILPIAVAGVSTLTTTTFLIPSIHCSTCASFIKTLIRQIDPDASVETSIISHTISIRHDDKSNIKKMTRALGDAGYEVHTVATGPEAQAKLRYSPKTAPPDDDFILGRLFNQVPKPWDFVGRRRQEQARNQHVSHCNECRSQLVPGSPAATISDGDVAGEKHNEAFVVVEPSSATPELYQATLTIDGMTCSSCVGNVTESLLSQSWIEAADVALLTRSATVRFQGGPDKAQAIVDLIEDGGYDSKLEQVGRVPSDPEPRHRDPSSDTWRADLSIGGMSCSSCVGSITHAVEELPWVKTVDVNLLTNSATVVFQDRAHLDELVSIITDAGYTTKLGDLVNMDDTVTSQDRRRTVQIRINGMYCEHCPGKVLAALQDNESHLDIEEAPSLQNPIMTVSYTPKVPTLTIRTILSSISEADEALSPVIYHPPTIEERARQMQARSRRRLLYRLLLAIAAAIPGLIIGVVYMTLVSKDDRNRMYLMERLNGVSRGEIALLVASTPVYFFSADVFHRRSIKEVYAMWKPGSHVPLLRRFYRFGSMDMLVSFATSIAYFASIAELIIAATNQESHHHMPERMPYFDSVIFLTMFLLAGRMIEAYSKAKTGEAVTQLGNLRPKEALLVTPSGDQDQGATQLSTVPVDTLETGDSVVVVHGGSPPWDGILLDKTADFAESSLTGESRPVKKSMGDEVYAGTINKGAPITMRIHGAAGKSLLDNIITVVREGQSKRAPIERVADTITGYFVPFVTLVAIVVWLTWLGLGVSGRLPQDYKDTLVGGWPFWSLQFAIAVFVIACPCGIGLAAPTALFVGGGLAAKHGILAKGGGEAFQEASDIDAVVFDKTGTLTEGGGLKLVDHLVLEESSKRWDENTLLTYVGEMEKNSSHPLGKALVAFCDERGLRGNSPQDIEEMPGKGMRATFFDKESLSKVEILVGNETLMGDHSVGFSQATIETLDTWKEQAMSVVLVAARDASANEEWVPAAIFSASDPIRPESKSVVEALRARGVDVWMISGDNAKTARAVGAMVSIAPDHIIAGVLPEQKADKVKYLQGSQPKKRRGLLSKLSGQMRTRAVVAMVGDGVNDSPALTAADVGIAIGAGSDVAISAAEFVLIKSDLNSLLTLVQLSRVVFRRVMFNFIWAGIYNLVALPIAAGVIYPVRSNGSYTRLDPVWASLAMALSSLSVICSSLLLRTTLPLVGFRNSATSDSTSKN